MSESKKPDESPQVIGHDFESEDTLRAREAAEVEREACARLVESATDAHDLHEIARRIRERKGQS